MGFSADFDLTVCLSAPLPWTMCASNTRKGNRLFQPAGTPDLVSSWSDSVRRERNIHNNRKTLLIVLNLDLELPFKNLLTGSCELTAAQAAAFWSSWVQCNRFPSSVLHLVKLLHSKLKYFAVFFLNIWGGPLSAGHCHVFFIKHGACKWRTGVMCPYWG